MRNILKYILLTVFLFVYSYANGQVVIHMEKDGGVYKIPCEINGLRLKLIFDTGASRVCISGSIADMMLENGYLSKDDICGSGQSVVADGRIVDNTIVNIKELIIGGVQLSNVEAVVIHQQSAPLLLGQSAIQKLGLVSISDDKLIINEHSHTPVATQKNYSVQEIDEYFRLAREAMNNEAFELAVEYYKILFSQDELSSYGKYRYADCLRMTDKNLEALSVYKEITNDFGSFDQETQMWIYYGMQRCCANIGDNNTAIQYGQLAIQKTTFAEGPRVGILYGIARAYKNMGNEYQGLRTFTNEIQKYLSYMGIKATDCWDKEYKDPYLAELYYYAYLMSSSTSDIDKYTIISAAWGYDNAIENAKRYYLTYTEKPRNYVY